MILTKDIGGEDLQSGILHGDSEIVISPQEIPRRPSRYPPEVYYIS